MLRACVARCVRIWHAKSENAGGLGVDFEGEVRGFCLQWDARWGAFSALCVVLCVLFLCKGFFFFYQPYIVKFMCWFLLRNTRTVASVLTLSRRIFLHTQNNTHTQTITHGLFGFFSWILRIPETFRVCLLALLWMSPPVCLCIFWVCQPLRAKSFAFWNLRSWDIHTSHIVRTIVNYNIQIALFEQVTLQYVFSFKYICRVFAAKFKIRD